MPDLSAFPITNLIGNYQAGELVHIDASPGVQRALEGFLARPAVARGLEIPKGS